MAIYDFLLKANGVDTATFGFGPWQLDGNWNSPDESYEEVSIPGRSGTTRTTLTPTTGALDLAITGTLSAATETAFEDARDLFLLLLSTGTLTIIVGNRDTRQRTGSLKGGVKVAPFISEVRGGDIKFTVHCEDPNAYDTSVTTVTGSSATDLAVALGTRKVSPVITVTTPSFPLVITYKSFGGTTLGTLTVLSGSGTVVADCDLQTITIGGTRHDEQLSAGDFFALDPRDGDYALSHWPTVRVSSGSPSIAYRKAY